MKSVLDIRIICWRNLGEKYRIDTKNSLVNHAHHDRYAHIFLWKYPGVNLYIWYLNSAKVRNMTHPRIVIRRLYFLYSYARSDNKIGFSLTWVSCWVKIISCEYRWKYYGMNALLLTSRISIRDLHVGKEKSLPYIILTYAYYSC